MAVISKIPLTKLLKRSKRDSFFMISGALLPAVAGTVAGATVTVTLIFLSALLTAIGIFDNIARVAGAGTLVPVTGFANAVVSPALDTKSEGLILGVGAKIFTIAGPVLLYSVLSGTLYGVIYYVVRLLF